MGRVSSRLGSDLRGVNRVSCRVERDHRGMTRACSLVECESRRVNRVRSRFERVRRGSSRDLRDSERLGRGAEEVRSGCDDVRRPAEEVLSGAEHVQCGAEDLLSRGKRVRGREASCCLDTQEGRARRGRVTSGPGVGESGEQSFRGVSDTDLRELERQTQRTPDDAGAWLALARAQARVGARDEALAGFYLAAALGGDLVETRAGLRALGAAASPWSHPDGDAGRSRCSPLRGPRRGEIVARAPLRDGASLIVLAEDGTITVAQPGGPLARFEGRTLSPLPTVELGPSRESWWPRAHAFPAAVAGGLVAVHDSHLHFLSRERIVSLELGEPARHLYDPIAVGDRVAILTEDRNRVDPRVSVRTLPNLEESGSFRIGSSWHVLAADSEV